MIWNAIALHSSIGIAEAHSPEAAVVHWGAGVDVGGLSLEGIDEQDTHAVLSEIPRGEEYAATFRQLIEEAARRAPQSYTMSWLAATAARHAGHPLPTSEEFVFGQDPFVQSS